MAIKTYKSGSTEQLSKNFRAYEFACTGKTCCSDFKVDEQLVAFLQAIRDHFGKPVNISSAYRCAKRNKATVVAIEEFERAGGWKSLTGVE